MFREEYIKDNELIKPDDDFLRRLKESVKQDDDIVHIGEYVDYDNAENFEKIGRTDTVVIDIKSKKARNSGWKTFSFFAACFVLICTIAFTIGKTGVIGGEGLQAGVESAFSKSATKGTSDFRQEYMELYNKVCDLFATSNFCVYEMASCVQDDELESGDKFANRYRKLTAQETDALVDGILAGNYGLADTTEEFDFMTYYLAEFENQVCVMFITDSKQFIYVVKVSGMQNID